MKRQGSVCEWRVTVKELAQMLMLTEARVYDLCRSGLFDRDRDGMVPLQAALHSYVAYRFGQA